MRRLPRFLTRASVAAVGLGLVLLGLPGCQGNAVEQPTARAGPAGAGIYDGPSTITERGTVLDSVEVRMPLVIAADDVTIRNTSFRATTSVAVDEPLLLIAPGTTGARISGSSFSGPGPDPQQAPASGVKLYGDDVWFSDNTILGIAGDAVTIDGTEVVVERNRIADFVVRQGVHYDAIVYGGAPSTDSVVIRGNTIQMWLDEGMTALISLPSDAPLMVVQDNLLSGGGYALTGGGGGTTFVGNRFSTRFASRCGSFGTHAYIGQVNGEITWRNNTWADGPDAGRLVGL